MLKSSLEMIGQKKTQSHNYGFAESLDRYRSGKMCGRFTLTVDAHQIREAFPWITLDHDIQPRFNIAPSQPIAVVANDGLKTIDYYQWGLIPSWGTLQLGLLRSGILAGIEQSVRSGGAYANPCFW